MVVMANLLPTIKDEPKMSMLVADLDNNPVDGSLQSTIVNWRQEVTIR